MKTLKIRLISAGAGTGKTYRITKELSELLTLTTSAYKPSQIIATTFTSAAAGELKNRIKEKILEEGKIDLLPQIDQALVDTVNSVSHQLLSLFAFEIGLSPNLKVMDDDEKDMLFHHALSLSVDVLKWEQIDKIASRFSIDRKEVRNIIKSISDHARNNALLQKQLEVSRKDSISSLKKLLPSTNKNKAKTEAALKKVLPTVRQKAEDAGDTTAGTRDIVKMLEAFLYKLQQSFDPTWYDWAKCADAECNRTAEKAGIFEGVFELMQDHIRFPEFQDDLTTYINFCFDAAITSMETFKQLKSERGLVDFIDQENLLLHALEQPEIQKRFREQFKVLFVDEFQDTSPIQLALFLKMAELVDKVIWVGDSKQAIYGFRNSDAQLINSVTKQIGKTDKSDILETSYRSRPELVNIVNQAFLPKFSNSKNSLSKEQIVLQPYRKQNIKLSTAFQLWGFQWKAIGKTRDTNSKYQSQVAERVKIFLAEKNQVEDAVTNELREIKAGDICILCRTNNNCTGMANALREQGFQAVVSNTGLIKTAEWRLLKACLHLLVDHSDSLSKAEVEFLISDQHDVSEIIEERIQNLKLAGDNSQKKKDWLNNHPIMMWIHSNRHMLLTESISGIIKLIYAGLDFNSIVMQWGNGAQRHANLEKILSYATTFEDYCLKLALLPNIHGFLSWFEGLAEDNLDSRGLVTNEQSVNVFTYHAAKGLEWPVVILYDTDYARDADVFNVRVKAKDKIDVNEPLKDRTLQFWPWPYFTNEYGAKSGYKEFLACCTGSDDYATIVEKENIEALRLSYVGFTRARDYIIVPFKAHKEDCYLKTIVDEGITSILQPDKVDNDSIVYKNKLFNEPVRLWTTVYSDFADRPESTETKTEVYIKKERKEYTSYYITPSGTNATDDISFREGVDIHSSFSEEKINVEKSEWGTFIHRVLCAYDPGIKEDDFKKIIKRLAACYGIENTKLLKEMHRNIQSFYKWVEKEYKPEKIYKELPLMMEKYGQLISGIADLVLEKEDEVLLVDYKTFTGDAVALSAMAKSFSGQLQHYINILKIGFPGKTVRAGIYFVMEGKFVESEVMQHL